MIKSLKDDALHYHATPKPGKIRIQATKPLSNQRDLALAYSPGVAEPCLEIQRDPILAGKHTSRSNLVGVISNGTAVLGLGNIGALASKPVMEGKAILFKNFADVDAYDIEIDETDVDKFVDTVARLEPTFGGINLEDIKAPECFEIEEKLRKRMNIPVFHDDQHGTAIVSSAAVINGLRIVNKKISEVKLTVSGAGAAAVACTNLLISMGLSRDNILMLDSRGVIHTKRDDLSPLKQEFSVDTHARDLKDALQGCDIFLGLSQPDLISVEMLMTMAENPLILAMANPIPEILPELVYKHRPDAIMATGRSDYPNQVNNVLCFPFLFRGALDVGATSITDEMKIACVHALADLAQMESNELVASYYKSESLVFGPDYILPKPFDPRLITTIAPAVAQAAIDSGVATMPFRSKEEYKKSLEPLVYRTGNVMRPLFERAKDSGVKVVYSDGANERVLRAIQDIVSQNYAKPILIGDSNEINAAIKKLNLTLKEGRDYTLVSSVNSTSVERINTAGALLESGEADAVLTGPSSSLQAQIEHIRPFTGLKYSAYNIAVMQLLLLDTATVFIADTGMAKNPSAKELAMITSLAAKEVARIGMTPRVALMSHSNFGSFKSESSEKMASVRGLLHDMMPELEVDGEMRGNIALDSTEREKSGLSRLTGNANLLVMPNLDAANITYTTLKALANGISVGPILLGSKTPINTITENTTPRGILNLTCLLASRVKKQ